MRKETAPRVERMIAKLRSRGCRITPQRLAILRVLAESAEHPSAESVYARIQDRFPTTSLATVYKTIAALKAAGEVLELGFADGSSRYDGNNPSPHPHLICVRCGGILDAGADGFGDVARAIAQDAGYRLVGHRFDVYGVCPSCAQESSDASR